MSRILDVQGNPVGLNITKRGNAVIENSLENSIHYGRRFYLSSYEDVTTDDEITFLFVPAEGYDIHIDTIIESDVDCIIQAYFMATIGDYGTEQLLLPRSQRFAGNSMFFKAYKGTTIINGDEVLTLSSKLFAGKHTSASRVDNGEFVLAYPYKSFLRITANGDGSVNYDFGFSEIEASTYY
jgi:hypothetical protein